MHDDLALFGADSVSVFFSWDWSRSQLSALLDTIRLMGELLGPSTGLSLTSLGQSGLRDQATHLVREVHMSSATSATGARTFIKGVHGVRYQVKDVARSVAFYTQQLGFKLEHQHLPAFASVSLGEATILLSGPGASGSRPLPGG